MSSGCEVRDTGQTASYVSVSLLEHHSKVSHKEGGRGRGNGGGGKEEGRGGMGRETEREGDGKGMGGERREERRSEGTRRE